MPRKRELTPETFLGCLPVNARITGCILATEGYENTGFGLTLHEFPRPEIVLFFKNEAVSSVKKRLRYAARKRLNGSWSLNRIHIKAISF